MKRAYINGSPKPANSTSEFLLSAVKKQLQDPSDFFDYNVKKQKLTPEICAQLRDCDTWIMAFPLYVDGIPAHLLSVLLELEQMLTHQQHREITVYALVTCGFYEGRQTRLAIAMLQSWCDKSGLIWGQAVGNGAGEMLNVNRKIPLGRGPNTNLGKALEQLCRNITNSHSGEPLYLSPNFPRLGWKITSTYMFWHPQAKANGVSLKEIKRKAPVLKSWKEE